jgi:lipoprotein-releasing system permease protein
MKARFLPLLIAWRYIRAKRRNQFVSFISLVSMTGIALGVMVLVTVLSVFNGFNHVIKRQLFSMVPHITVTGNQPPLMHWRTLDKKLKRIPTVTGVSPYVSGQALLSAGTTTQPAMVMGIEPDKIDAVSQLSQKMQVGKLSALKAGQYGIVLGETLAANLGVYQGDYVNLMVPKISVTPVGMLPRFRRFRVVGIFHAGIGFGFDSAYAFINLRDAQHLYVLNQGITGVQMDVQDLFAAPMLASKIQSLLGYHYQVADWSEQYGAFYHTIQLQKTMSFLIILLLIAIATFNLVSSLVMLVNEKQSDIAILRTLGMTPKAIMTIFVLQGCIVGLIGLCLGLIAGVLLSLNITALVNFIQHVFNVQLLNSSVNFVNYLPSQLSGHDLLKVSVVAFGMSLLATLYPAWRASKILPAEALRYE